MVFELTGHFKIRSYANYIFGLPVVTKYLLDFVKPDIYEIKYYKNTSIVL